MTFPTALILASAGDMADNIGYWVLAAGIVIPMCSAVLAVFLTRREFEAHKAETERRLAVMETGHAQVHSKIGGVERGARAETDAKTERLRQEIGSLRGEIIEMERRLNASSEVRAKDTHDRINEVLEAVSELRGQVNSHQP